MRSLVVTTFGRPGYVRRAIEAGASGFVVKDTPARQLADAVRRVHAGLRVIDPDLAAESLIDGPSPLTGRERELLHLRPRRVAGRHDRRARAPVGGHGPQPPVGRDRQDRRDHAQRGGADRAGPRLAVRSPNLFGESASRAGDGDVSSARSHRTYGRVAPDGDRRVTQHDSEGLFSAAFWLACEREAAQLLRPRAGVDDE